MAHRQNIILQRTDNISSPCAFHSACKSGNIEMVSLLLNFLPPAEREQCIIQADSLGDTPLMKACESGHLQLVKYLLDSFSSHEKQRKYILQRNFVEDLSALCFACQKGHASIVTLLLDSLTPEARLSEILHQGAFHRTCLIIACENGHTSIANILLQILPTDEQRYSYIMHQQLHDHHTAISQAFRTGHSSTAIHLLDSLPNDEMKQSVILQPTQRSTVLIYACQNNSLPGVRFLLDALPPSAQRLAFIRHCDNYDNQALDYACESGDIEIMLAILACLPSWQGKLACLDTQNPHLSYSRLIRRALESKHATEPLLISLLDLFTDFDDRNECILLPDRWNDTAISEIVRYYNLNSSWPRARILFDYLSRGGLPLSVRHHADWVYADLVRRSNLEPRMILQYIKLLPDSHLEKLTSPPPSAPIASYIREFISSRGQPPSSFFPPRSLQDRQAFTCILDIFLNRLPSVQSKHSLLDLIFLTPCGDPHLDIILRNWCTVSTLVLQAESLHFQVSLEFLSHFHLALRRYVAVWMQYEPHYNTLFWPEEGLNSILDIVPIQLHQITIINLTALLNIS
eukprot:TRINITY_DN4118_c0_g1::TRINITY_DN4118_c0_g1_i1::g.2187::m.2187 TRINITY_DN4118_c0_g1::TRINITY_DN4118_c0_g1_i1::g.2187  ORF type:complete len:672 (-),score=40.29,sp/Q9VCA8/ANKHM_DROME/29.64/1e-14,sp/Q9VCA8/ANKHM_DROME/25.42/2e-11,sp/Q9VCA8/ANKHM_DROME/26.03/2e-09,sp/Q9VCA8/ANKHM_DROME/29.64/3e-09,sp/Q9VCA8/ANKHM_DROME/28.96/1e-08,sp/Q9VCA8/ANKHM_DROME/27.68/2e-06,Ank_2/PF12796.2/1.8e-05,Ank_2/PF12796.2/6.5e-11,Ank_2/PF12796.2/1.7e-05,Ank_2/PF12796.2/1e-09,Ank_2/PF12796.2/0.0008,Ank_2/PF12796.2/0.00